MKAKKSVEEMTTNELEEYMDQLEEVLSQKEDEQYKLKYKKEIAKNKLYEVVVSFGIPVLAPNEKEAKRIVSQDFHLNCDYSSYDDYEFEYYEYESALHLLNLEDKDFEQIVVAYGTDTVEECFGDRPTVKEVVEFMTGKKGKK